MSEERRRDPVPLPTAWWGPRRAMPPRPRSIVELIAGGLLDAELAALLWLLIGARLPVVVVGPAGVGRTTLLTALLDFLPADARPVPLAGAEEDFEWLPEAPELGWRRERSTATASGRAAGTGAVVPPPPRRPSASSTVLLVAELGDRPPLGTWGPRARIAIRAVALGYGMAATMTGERLEDVLDRLRAAPVGADDDELSRLGVVLALGFVDGPGAVHDEGPEAVHDDLPRRRRVVAAHYLRPVVRDSHGHVQRMPPAVLAAYEPRTDHLEHFAWGIVADLAGRTGLRPVAFEREQARRAGYLAGLVSAGIVEPDAVRGAIAGYLRTSTDQPA